MLAGLTIGKLDRQLTFERNTPTIDAIGNTPIDSWGNSFTVWASVTTNSQNENFENGQQTATRSVEVITRYNASIDETTRFTDVRFSRVYYVKSVEQNLREGYTKLTAESRDNQ